MTSKEVVKLQDWWMGELRALTQKVMDQETKRQSKRTTKLDKLLEDYNSPDQILDAYGFGCITEKQYDKLRSAWEERENAKIPDVLYREKLNLLSELYQEAKKIMEDNNGKD